MTETHAARSGGRDMVRDGLDERRPPRWMSLAAWAGIVGPILFTATFLAQEAFRSDEYSPIAETVSALEAGPNGWVQQAELRRLRAADDRLRDRAAPRRTAEQGGHRRPGTAGRQRRRVAARRGPPAAGGRRRRHLRPGRPRRRRDHVLPGQCGRAGRAVPAAGPRSEVAEPRGLRPVGRGRGRRRVRRPWARSSCRTRPRCTTGPAWGSDCSSSSSCSPAGSSCPSGCCAQRPPQPRTRAAVSPSRGEAAGPAVPHSSWASCCW